MHLDLDHAVALAGLAAPALHIEAEPPGLVAARLGFRQAGEPVADRAEGAGIGRRVRARRAPDRALVDVDHLVEIFEALKAVIGLRRAGGAVQLAGQRLVQRLDDQGRLAAARHARDAGETAQRDRRGDILQVVAGRALQRDLALGLLDRAAFRNRDLARAVEIVRRHAFRVGQHFGWRTFGNDLAAMHARRRPHVDDMVGRQDRILIVLNHDHGIAEVAQPFQRFQQARIVALVQADTRLVEYIEHAGQARADLAGQPDALALAARQGAGSAAERQVFEADIIEEVQPVIDLFQDAAGNLVLLLRQRLRHLAEPVARILDREFGGV